MKQRLAGGVSVLTVAVAMVSALPAAAGAKIALTDAVGVFPSAAPQGKAFFAGVCDLAAPDDVAAGSDPADTPADPVGCLDFGTFVNDGTPNAPSPWMAAPSWRLADAQAAGAHPDATTSFALDVTNHGHFDLPTEDPNNVVVDLPAGVLGNPNVVAECSLEEFGASPHQCPPSSQVGVTTLRLDVRPAGHDAMSVSMYPVYNLEPRRGYTAEFGIPDIATTPMASGGGSIGASIRIFAFARTDGDFGVSAGAMSIPTQFPLIAQSLTIWGVPWAASHDRWRESRASAVATGSGILLGGLDPGDRASYEASWGPIRPFFVTETDCNPAPVTAFTADSYQNPGAWLNPDASMFHRRVPDRSDGDWEVAGSQAPPVTGCGALPFEPDMSVLATGNEAGGASGLDVDLAIPQNDSPPASVAGDPNDATGAPAHWKSGAGRATAHLKDTAVTLPDGMSVSPSAAAGLRACSDVEIGLRQAGSPPRFNNGDPFDKDGGADGAECPDGSKIGTAVVHTPLLDDPLTGEVVLGEPKSTDPRSGEMFRLFIVVRNRDRGVIAKVYGSTVADPATGQLTTTFLDNPEVPFDRLDVDIKGGPRGLLALPQTCGQRSSTSVFTPWTAAHGGGGVPRTVDSTLIVDQRCGHGFAPGLQAGIDNSAARGGGTFSFRFSRQDGEQYLRGLIARLPQGLLASVNGVPLCSNAAADAGACPAGSKIGIIDAKAGAGDPFVLEEKGEVFLTEGYKGGEYGLAVKIRPVAGPFRGAMELSPIIVRQAIHVDRKTAQVTAVSDPLPLIHHGVPLRVREVTVLVDRHNFMLNPSDCSPKQVQATILSAEGTRAEVANHFQAANCADLRFKPRLRLALKGRRQVRTGKHPAIRAVVRQQGIPEAGIAKAEVRLPKSLALDVNNAQELCEFDDGTKPDLENHCPKGSIVGHARAKTPLLNDDLVGNVYFVKNIRIDPDTGNEIRTLPMIVVALRGEIAVNLVGESDTTRSGKLVNTFDNVPDAPITRFNLNIQGGKNGILAVTRTRRSRINLCAKPRSHVAEADMDGQNGKRHDFNVRMNTPCRKRRQSAAKVCRKRTDTKQGFRRCVTKVKRHRAQKRRAAQKRKAAKRSGRAGGASRS